MSGALPQPAGSVWTVGSREVTVRHVAGHQFVPRFVGNTSSLLLVGTFLWRND